ncbi:hypothetical protein E3N88_09664 [Mikania micrantha]|uniref:Uncharacterized protein n=1 Tax=Mikania micrantha TaxID=192012 RepID=A0A5N6PKJ8_9ASTR|nr:hypothetical protein E3N88_09664 [Mikania micrantha]
MEVPVGEHLKTYYMYDSTMVDDAGNCLRWKYRWVNILRLELFMTPQWWIARGASNCLRWKYRWVNILRLTICMTPQWWIVRGLREEQAEERNKSKAMSKPPPSASTGKTVVIGRERNEVYRDWNKRVIVGLISINIQKIDVALVVGPTASNTNDPKHSMIPVEIRAGPIGQVK